MLQQDKTENGETRSPATSAMVRNGLVSFGVGAAVGATLALLFAPKPGSELRGDIASATRKGYDATKEKAIDLRDQSTDAVKAVKEKAGTVYDFAVEKLAAGKEAVSDAVNATTGAVMDGIDHLENESVNPSATRASSRRPSNIM